MSTPFISYKDITGLSIWQELQHKRLPISFDLEITARCNNNCRHCYINLPASDAKAAASELSLAEINAIADEAVSMGTLSCVITGGEPLLRKDFADIYMTLKRKGLLVSVYTNATLLTEGHIELFGQYPPRDLEVTVYGATKETYEKITGVQGSFEAFMKGLSLLSKGGIKTRLKAMAMRSNLHELPLISGFCRERTADYFRFDPHLHMRFDRDEKRNALIQAERLTPTEIAAAEKSDQERFTSLLNNCNMYIQPEPAAHSCEHIFRCNAGKWTFTVGCNGMLRICPSLWHPACMYDLRKGSLKEAWEVFIPCILDIKSDRREFHEACGICPVINLCMWCPAHAYLETGELDLPVKAFCSIAKARSAAIKENKAG